MTNDEFGLVMLGILLFLSFMMLPLTLLRIRSKSKQRLMIGQLGVERLGEECPICSGKLLAIDPFVSYKERLGGLMIGAARCNKCGHVEVFS